MREGSPPHTCHVSGVTCHMSHVTYHLSHITYHVSDFNFYFFYLIFWGGQSGEASQGRVCYQRLPRLVLHCTVYCTISVYRALHIIVQGLQSGWPFLFRNRSYLPLLQFIAH